MRILTTVMVVMLLAGCSQQRDYVSSYDFNTALLEDLPWEMGKAIVGSNDAFRYDLFVGRNHSGWNYVQHALGWSRYVELICKSNLVICLADNPSSIIPQYDRIDSETCRLKDGELRHELCCSNGIVGIGRNSYGIFEFGIEPLEYRDFNQDGYMDVLVRRGLGGSVCPSEKLILSRKQPDGMFYVVEHVEYQYQVGEPIFSQELVNGEPRLVRRFEIYHTKSLPSFPEEEGSAGPENAM